MKTEKVFVSQRNQSLIMMKTQDLHSPLIHLHTAHQQTLNHTTKHVELELSESYSVSLYKRSSMLPLLLEALQWFLIEPNSETCY